MEIIKLDINHIDKIYDLFLEQFKNEAWSKRQIEESLKSNSSHFYGIFDNLELICVSSILVSLDDINLLDIATKENYKRKGLAKNMLRFLISLKKDNQTFSLEVKSTNAPAISLYKSFGFETLNVRKKYYKDGSDALCMFLNSHEY